MRRINIFLTSFFLSWLIGITFGATVLLYFIVFFVLYGIVVFGWSGWQLRKALKRHEPWKKAIDTGDWAACELFKAEANKFDEDYKDFCRRFAPFLLR